MPTDSYLGQPREVVPSKPMNGIEQIDADRRDADEGAIAAEELLRMNMPDLPRLLADAYRIGHYDGMHKERRRHEIAARSAAETTAVTRDTPNVREIFERHDRCSKLLWGPASLPGMMLGPEDADAAHRDRGTLLSLIPGPPLHPKTGAEP